VVDDNATNRAALADTMHSWGMIADAVQGGDEALAALRQRSAGTQPFDVILVDAQMPGMDGAKLARTIRLEPGLAKTPLIMMGPAKKAEASRARGRNGSNRWLSKPIKPSHLHATLCALLASGPAIIHGPQDKVELAAPPAGAVPKNGKSPFPMRILVVDDNLVNRKVAQKQLERLGYLVDTVDGGEPALAAMVSAQYPVVLLDCEMPEMDGYATTAEIRRRENGDRHTTIIAMTGHALEGARERCLESGMDEYVAKPVTLDALAAVLDAALSE
jgi:two-component system sensor histidine kinase/response regulator